MAQYKVPQDVQREDKIFGPFSLRQFLYLLGGSMGSYLFFSIIKSLTGSTGAALLFAFIIFISISAFAVIEIQGKSLPEYVTAFLLYILKPSKRVWRKDIYVPDIAYIPQKKKDSKNIKEKPKKRTTAEVKSQLETLAHVLDTRGWAGLEEQEETREIENTHKRIIEEEQKEPQKKTNDNKIAEKIAPKETSPENVKIEKEIDAPKIKASLDIKPDEKPTVEETISEELTPQQAPQTQQSPQATENEPQKTELNKPKVTPAISPQEQKLIQEKAQKKEMIIKAEMKKLEDKLKKELQEKAKKELQEKAKEDKANIKKFKETIGSIEKIVKSEKTTPPKIRKKIKIKPVEDKPKVDLYQEAYTESLAGRMTTPRFIEPKTNIKIDESQLDDILEETEEIKTLKKEISEIGKALKKQKKSKNPPKIIKGGQAFYK